MTEANLQTDGLEERPAQRAVDHHETEEEDSSPIIHQRGPLSQGCQQAVSI